MAKAKKKALAPVDFLVGDRVTWSSQAAGSWKEKTGVIVEAPAVGEWFADNRRYRRLATARHRYCVQVTTKHSRGERTDLYFPSTSALRKAS